jgi:molybdenum cofactor synthesis domain-containing protein
VFRKLLTFDEAQEAIRKRFKPKPLGTEEIPLLEAHSRVLAEDVTSGLDVPPFNRSTVDGYAVKAEDTFGANEKKPVRLAVSGTVSIGELPKVMVTNGRTVEIATGAPMPEGADAVVMVEDTEWEGNRLSVSNAAARDENVMKAGSDIKNGQTVLRAGTMLAPREIGVLAAVGHATPRVYLVPRVAVLSTGGEITQPGKRLPPGKIYDVNAYSLCAAVTESGGKPVHLGVVQDNRVALEMALARALASADVVVTSGGVSVGPRDLVPQTVGSLGKPGVIFSGVAIKPGKPITFAAVGGKPVFSLPGHPASALLVFHLFARPVVCGMAGRKEMKGPKVRAVAGMRMFPANGRRTFVMVALRKDKQGRSVADPVESGASGAITTLAKADGFVELTEDVQFVDEGEEVAVSLFKSPR